MFNDEVYNNLDDISKLLEPFTCKVNDVLAKIPESIEIEFSVIKDKLFQKNGSVGDKIDIYFSDAANATINNNYPELKQLNISIFDFFDIQLKPHNNDDISLTYDYVSDKRNFDVFLFKKNSTISEESIKQKIVQYIGDSIKSSMQRAKTYSSTSFKELASLFDIDIKGARANFDKRRKIREHFEDLLKNDELMIRDLELAKRFSLWIKAFLINGDLGAIKNLCKIKILMHKKQPIYSIQDEEVVNEC